MDETTREVSETTNAMIQKVNTLEKLLEIRTDRLERLRILETSRSDQLTQQETRTLETKLVKMFAELLLTKQKLPESNPSSDLQQWLRIVGLCPDTVTAVVKKVETLEKLLSSSEENLHELFSEDCPLTQQAQDEASRRLICAISSLNKCQQCIKSGGQEPTDMYWDHIRLSSSPRTHHRHPPETSHAEIPHESVQSPIELSSPDTMISSASITAGTITSSSTDKLLNTLSPDDNTCSNFSPSPSPPNSPANIKHPRQIYSVSKSMNNNILSPNNYNSHTVHQHDLENGNGHEAESDPFLTKSKSQISINGPKTILTTCPEEDTKALVPTPLPRTRFIESMSDSSHMMTPPLPAATTVIVSDTSGPPRSPCTPVRGMGHMIKHRFTKKFKFTSSSCDVCSKQMFFGFKCTDCKYRCHKDCKSSAPASCGLPKELMDEFKRQIQSDQLQPQPSPNMLRQPGLLAAKRNEHRHRAQQIHTHLPFHGPDSSSAGSSCNSSSPSSPALLALPPQTPATSKQSQFNFPEVPQPIHVTTANHHHLTIHLPNRKDEDAECSHSLHSDSINKSQNSSVSMLSSNYQYQHSLKSLNEMINSQPSLDEGTQHVIPRVHLSELADTHQSNDSDKTISTEESDRTPRYEADANMWPRQNSLSLKEWDIPYDDLHLKEEIGHGRFGTVYRALWHGDVAVKLLKEDYKDDNTLEAFKLEVATFKKTRHDNLVLFMGACMKPPRLAIVTSLCKGNTLYTHIYLRKDKFNLNRTTLISQQISQGMGYLHARGIVHKDLKTKNLFLENEKIIITDFGLFSVTKLLYGEMGLGIPNDWLCYLAPELIRNLKPYRPTNEDLPFSKASDSYAFGTIWYELLCGELPFKKQPPESVIWQVGKGMKPALANLQASRDVKDILMLCWSFQADDRPDFALMFNMLERLPKKRLARSPSHPVQLHSKSAESVF